MVNQRLTPLDFAKLTEETDRLAEHVAEVRRRMMEAAMRKEQRSRMGFHVVVSDPAKPAAEPVSTKSVKQSPPASSRTPATKRPVSGVYAIVRDISAGRYSFIAEREAPISTRTADLPSVAKKKISA